MPKHLQFAFDLFSDLHVDHWETADWSGQPTSLLAVVAGNISADLDRTVYELHCLSRNYRQVLYIDGVLEHSDDFSAVHSNRNYLCKKLSKFHNVTHLHEQVLIINDVAFVGATLWWAPHETCSSISDDDWIQDMKIPTLHNEDLDFMQYTRQRLQKSSEVSKVIMVSSTVPSRMLALTVNQIACSSEASNYVQMEDRYNKLSHWCFGHCEYPVKHKEDYFEFVSNPKGKPETSSGLMYQPMRVMV